MDHAVYLDHNATTPTRAEAVAAVTAALALTGNASSVHRFGRVVRRVVEDAREAVAGLVGAEPAEVVFTSGGTEANNLALKGSGRRRVLASAAEHASVLNAGAAVTTVPVDGDGIVCLDVLDMMLAADQAPAVVAVMLANNETGVIQPVADAAAIAHRHGALLLCDAVQAAGRIAVDMDALGCDLLSISAHKLGGPPGAGALVVRGDLALAPVIGGGGQERGRRAGTENAAAVAGFGVAARLARDGRAGEAARLGALRDRLEAEVRALAPEAVIPGARAPRLPNTSAIALPGVAAETQVMALDLAGVAVSAGAACSSGKVKASHVLAAMGVSRAVATGTIRVSLGWTSSDEDVTRFLEAWGFLRRRVRGLRHQAA